MAGLEAASDHWGYVHDAASGSVTLPTACGGLPVVKTNVCVFVTGTSGEKTAACHFHQDP